MISYHNKKFRPVRNSDNAETDSGTIFLYKQEGSIITSTYKSKNVVKGHLIGLVGDGGTIDMRYHQINTKGELLTGTCQSTPEVLENGKIRLHEKWQWTSGDSSEGYSVLEEV